MDTVSLKILGLPMLAWIPLLPLLGATLNLLLGRRLAKGTIHTIAVGAVGAAFAIASFGSFTWTSSIARRPTR